MAEDRVLLVDLADELQIRKQRLFKLLPKLGIRTSSIAEAIRRADAFFGMMPKVEAGARQS